MNSNLNDKELIEKHKIYNILYKEQYRLKLGIPYLLATQANFILLIIAFIIFHFKYATLDIIMACYIACMVIYYRAFFHYTKDGHQNRIFIFRVASNFMKRVNKKLRENLDFNSAKKIKQKNIRWF